MPEAVADSVKMTLKSIANASSVPITRSTLIRNDQWQGYGNRIAGVESGTLA
jgi:hypothetical protein